MTLFVLSPRSVAYKRGKAGEGGWKADIKDSTPLKLVEGVNYSLEDLRRKENKLKFCSRDSELVIAWTFNCSSLKGNISKKDSLGGDPQPLGDPEMMGEMEETLERGEA